MLDARLWPLAPDALPAFQLDGDISLFKFVGDTFRVRPMSCVVDDSRDVGVSIELRIIEPAALPVLTGIVADKALHTELDRMDPELELERIDLDEFHRPFKIRSSTMLPITLNGVRQLVREPAETSTLPVEQRPFPVIVPFVN